jgi:hypothetical protein
MHRMKDFVREVEPSVAERFMQQVVGGGHRADQGILDRKAARDRSALAHCGNHVLHVATGKCLEVRPPASRCGLAERAVGTLDGYTHGSSEWRKEKPRQFTGGASMIRVESASALYQHRTGIEPRRD